MVNLDMVNLSCRRSLVMAGALWPMATSVPEILSCTMADGGRFELARDRSQRMVEHDASTFTVVASTAIYVALRSRLALRCRGQRGAGVGAVSRRRSTSGAANRRIAAHTIDEQAIRYIAGVVLPVASRIAPTITGLTMPPT